MGLLIASIILTVLAASLLYRVFRGPTAADRICALDAMDLLVALAMVLYSLHTGRAIYLDIALVIVLLGFVSTVFVGRYIEGRM